MTEPHGTFVWYELLTTDTAAAESFYGGVVGWGAKPAEVPGVDYTLLTTDQGGAAGLMALPAEASAAGARPGWVGYVAVRDVDTTVAEFTAKGGAVHLAPTDIPMVGRVATVADPQGAVIALITPQGEGQPPAAHALGHGGWRELLAADWESAFAFYAERFGWQKGLSVDMGPMGTYQVFTRNGADVGGMMTKPQAVPAPFWTYYFQRRRHQRGGRPCPRRRRPDRQRAARGPGRDVDRAVHRAVHRSAGRHVQPRRAALRRGTPHRRSPSGASSCPS